MARSMSVRLIGIILPIVIMVAASLISVPDGLTREGLLAMGALFSMISMIICQPFPIAVVALVWVVVGAAIGINSYDEAYAAWATQLTFFLIAGSSISTVMMKTTIPHRVINAFLKWANNSPKKVVLSFMISTALFSAVMNNIAMVLLFTGIAAIMLDAIDAVPLKSNLGKCLMIGVTAASMLGGICTPVGCALNIVVMTMLQNIAGIQVGFLQWCILATPTALVVLAAMYVWLIKLFPPEPVSDDAAMSIERIVKDAGKLSSYEFKAIIIVSLMMVFWIIGSYVPFFNVVLVAIAGLVLFMLPGVDALDWKEFCAGVPWQVILVFGGVSVIAVPFVSTGAAAWVADAFMSMAGGMGGIVLVASLALFIVLLNGVFPMGPAVVGLLGVPILMVALNSGGLLNPVSALAIVGIASEATFILPLSMTYLIAVDYGYFTVGDVLKSSVLPSVAMVLGLTFLMNPIASALF